VFIGYGEGGGTGGEFIGDCNNSGVITTGENRGLYQSDAGGSKALVFKRKTQSGFTEGADIGWRHSGLPTTLQRINNYISFQCALPRQE